METPPPDPAALLAIWMEWERGETTPGKVLADLKRGGMRQLLESDVLEEAAEAEGAPEGRQRLYPQRIPRPPHAQPGEPAPWAGLPAERRRGLRLDRVRHALRTPVDLRRRAQPGDQRRHSAVLAALFEEGGETRVVLTRRAATLSSHQSEVAFPGGRVEPGEAFAVAALREAWEEVRLDPRAVEIIGELTPMLTYTSSSFVNPFVGVLSGRPQLHANPTEVEVVFDAALADLLADGVYRAERWGLEDERELHFFELPGDMVWGATGRLLVELLRRVTGA